MTGPGKSDPAFALPVFSLFRIKADEMRRNAIEIPFDPICPGFFEADSRNGGQNIDPIRFHAQLDHLPGTCKISGVYTDLTETEFAQSLKHASGVGGFGPDQNIEVSRKPERSHAPITNGDGRGKHHQPAAVAVWTGL